MIKFRSLLGFGRLTGEVIYSKQNFCLQIFHRVFCFCCPFKEIELNTKCVVEMADTQIILQHPSTLDKSPER